MPFEGNGVIPAMLNHRIKYEEKSRCFHRSMMCMSPARLFSLSIIFIFGILFFFHNRNIEVSHNSHRLGSYSKGKERFTPRTCTLEELGKIRQQIPSGDSISLSTRCPVETWLNTYYEELYRNETVTDPFLGISLGCNKGDDAVDIMRLGSQNHKFDSSTWRSTMIEASKGQKFQSERACPAGLSLFPIVQPHFIRDARMHCVEPMPSTFKLLNLSMYKLGLEKHGFILNNLAVSSTSGIAFFPDAMPGVESLGLSTCTGNKSSVSGIECKEVHLRTLDEYVSEYVGENEAPINILNIDTEGFDFDVLWGSTNTLKRTQYLIFEYHETGIWPFHSIQEAMALLHNAEFTCYWAGNGKLWRIHDCWQRREMDQIYSWHGWSNIACVKNTFVRLAEIMESIFLETIE